MIFSSPIFLFAFLPLAIAGYFIARGKLQNLYLLVVSLVFYAWGEPGFVFVLVGAILFNYFCALIIDGIKPENLAKRWMVAVAVAGNVGLLFVYKYLGDLLHALTGAAALSLPFQQALLPLGISFFTFQSISYVVDVYYQIVKVEKNVINVGLYIAFFPKLLIGPIATYRSISEQIRNRSTDAGKFASGVKRFIVGLAKKAILSAPLGAMADLAFSQPPGQETVLLSWLGIVAYSLQLYFDFSGYSDMAIGLGKIFGFELPENFDYPYISKSRAGYWQRWHISLSAWFRDYLYTPLFRSLMTVTNPFTKRTLEIRTCDLLSLFVTWLLVGVWHGSGPQFVVYGLWWFFFIMIERLPSAYGKKKPKNPAGKATRPHWWQNSLLHAYTILVILFGLVFFRAPSLGYALGYLKNMVGIGAPAFYDVAAVSLVGQNSVVLLLGILFSLPFWAFAKDRFPLLRGETAVHKAASFVGYAGLLVVSIGYVVSTAPKNFLYFQF